MVTPCVMSPGLPPWTYAQFIDDCMQSAIPELRASGPRRTRGTAPVNSALLTPGGRPPQPPVNYEAMRYLVRERLFSITDDFWVTDEQGDKVFFVDAKILSLRHALELKDASGRKLATIKHQLVTFTDAMDIDDDNGRVATVHKAVFSPLHHRANIDLAGGGRLEAVGNLVDKEFEIRDDGQPIARVSRAWFRVRDTYGVDVAPGQDDALMICIAVCLDRIHAEEEEQCDRDR